jgi:signal-transduction protein with cAMP-binding, CBS, and nucleotidyltransferase domain
MILEIYSEPIERIPFLHNREPMFYMQHILKLTPLTFLKDTGIIRRGTKPEEVLFILSGVVENFTTKRFYKVGAFFGETDILQANVARRENFIASTDCFLLSMSKDEFLDILDRYEDVKNYVESIVRKRENHKQSVLSGKDLMDKVKQQNSIFNAVMDMLNPKKVQIKKKEEEKKGANFLEVTKMLDKKIERRTSKRGKQLDIIEEEEPD